MSIFKSILNKIFGSGENAQAATPAQATPSMSTPSTSAPAQNVDVTAILDRKLAQKGANLNWRTSIVDLMKLLDLDSSLSARKELAAELHYTGNTSDSASMNIWLHEQVMKKNSENGGIVPAELKKSA